MVKTNRLPSLSTKTIIAAPHIQLVLVEAARLAPRYSDELASLYERERQRGNGNRATLAVCQEDACVAAGREKRNEDFGSIKPFPNKEKTKAGSITGQECDCGMIC